MGEEQGLCWMCIEYWESEYRALPRVIPPYVHCHHEPKEKPKCWCEEGMIGRERWVSLGRAVKVDFCPECGRKLS